MRVLVTGGSGKVGRRLVPALLTEGYDVTVLHRGSAGLEGLPAGAKEVRASVSDFEAMCNVMKGVDAVCHLAALMPPSAEPELFETNIRGTFNVLEAVRLQDRAIRLVLASTDATYGTGLSTRTYPDPIEEGIEPLPTNFYGVTKVSCELMLESYRRLYGVDAVALRYSWIFDGAEALDLFTMGMWDEFMSEEQRGRLAGSRAVPVVLDESGGRFTEHVVDARDCAMAALLALAVPDVEGHAINVCGPAPFSYSEISPMVANRLGRELEELPLPGFHGYSFDTRKAQAMLGFEARYGIEDMLEEAFEALDV